MELEVNFERVLNITINSLLSSSDLNKTYACPNKHIETLESKEPMKFNSGDRVICTNGDGEPGWGWELGLQFTVTRVSSYSVPCYFGGKKGNGVYEPYLKLVSRREDMAVFEDGDRVRILGNTYDDREGFSIGHIGIITNADEDDFEVDDEHWYSPSNLEKVNVNEHKNEGDTTMSVFYKVIKETPELEVGAILQCYSDQDFVPISDLWTKEGSEEDTLRVRPAKKPAYYTRVWASEQDGHTVYVDKATARELLDVSLTLSSDKAAK